MATFEIDGSSNVDHSGWSVIATGLLSTADADPRTSALPLRAWAPHDRDRFVAIEIDQVSGRRLTGRP